MGLRKKIVKLIFPIINFYLSSENKREFTLRKNNNNARMQNSLFFQLKMAFLIFKCPKLIKKLRENIVSHFFGFVSREKFILKKPQNSFHRNNKATPFAFKRLVNYLQVFENFKNVRKNMSLKSSGKFHFLVILFSSDRQKLSDEL